MEPTNNRIKNLVQPDGYALHTRGTFPGDASRKVWRVVGMPITGQGVEAPYITRGVIARQIAEIANSDNETSA
jgi:hypothetical protein